jgi:hypothetical protein
LIAKKEQWYRIETEIYPTRACYSIDGKKYAEAFFNDVPTKGHFGFAVYHTNEKKWVKNVMI